MIELDASAFAEATADKRYSILDTRRSSVVRHLSSVLLLDTLFS